MQRLTLASFFRRRSLAWLALSLGALVFLEAGTVFLVADQATRAGISNILQSVATVLTASAFVAAMRRLRRERSDAAAGWTLFSVAAGLFVAGQLAYWLVELSSDAVGFPNSSDPLFLAACAVLIVALWRLPHERLTRDERWDAVLDLAVLILLAVVACWELSLGGAWSTAMATGDAASLVSLAYGLVNVALLLSIGRHLVLNLGHGQMFVPNLLLVTGLLFLAVANLAMVETGMSTAFTTGSLVDLADLLFIALAGFAGLNVLTRGDDADAGYSAAFRATWVTVFNYACLGAGSAVLVWGMSNRRANDAPLLEIVAIVVLVLAAARALRTVRRSARLAESLEQARAGLETRVRERTKELGCLYGIASLIEREDDLEAILQGTIELMPPAWLHPEVACARISLGELEFRTADFRTTAWRQASAISVLGQPVGSVELCYLEERPIAEEGRFLGEERTLIDAIAERLGRVTERKRAEEALRESEGALREAQRLAHIGSWRWTLATDAVHWSAELCDLLAYDPALPAPAFASMASFYTPESWKRLNETLATTFATGEPYLLDLDVVRTDGVVRSAQTSGTVDRDASGKIVGLHGTVLDITERKQAEAEIRALNEELEMRVLERTARLAAANKDLESFSYSVSHDLRAPLRAISGFASILGSRYRDQLDEKGRHYVDTIAAEGEHLGILMEELLDYARLGRSAVRAEPVPLGPVVTQLRATFGEQVAAAGGTLEVIEPLAVPQGDPVLLERILANLVENALTYRREGVPPRVRLSAVRHDDSVVISVADNGIGIPPAYRERIFEVFTRLHGPEAYPGTGIGLSIVRRAARLMGSEISVESVEGEGSTFALTLPAARQPALSAAPPAARDPGDSGP